MAHSEKPIVVSSLCLEFKACRWNGMVIPDPFARKLKGFVEFRPVCPECEIDVLRALPGGVGRDHGLRQGPDPLAMTGCRLAYLA